MVQLPVEPVVNGVFLNGEADWERELERFFSHFKGKYIYDYNHLDFLCIQMYLELLRYADKREIVVLETCSRAEFAEELANIYSLSGKQAFLTAKISQMAHSAMGTEVKSRLVRDIEHIIKEDYSSANMSLNYIADKTGRTVNYLSAVYKNETGNLRDFDTASVTDNAFVSDLFVFTAMTLPVLARSEDSLAKKTVFFRL